MAKTFPYTVPFLLINGDLPAREFERIEGSFDSTLTGDAVYEQGDLVEVASGKVRRATAAGASMPKVALAGQGWKEAQDNLPPADPAESGQQHWFLRKGVPMNLLVESDEIVFTFQGATADGSDHTFVQADLDLVIARTQVELKWNATEKTYTVTTTTTNPNVELVRVHDGGKVNDVNVRVVARLLPAFIR